MIKLRPQPERMCAKERGVSIIEILVAISLLGIVIVSSSNLIIVSMHANQAARTYSSVVADVQQIIDDYRGQGYVALLNKFGGSWSAITNGQTVVETTTSDRSRATYSVTLTAVKSSSDANPVAIQVEVSAAHRRGKFGDTTYTFHTMISQST